MPRGSAFATRVDILHLTSHRYTGNVLLGPHRLMIQPREGSGVQLVSSEILTNPPADLSWTEDVYCNSVAIAGFHSIAEELSITENGRRTARWRRAKSQPAGEFSGNGAAMRKCA